VLGYIRRNMSLTVGIVLLSLLALFIVVGNLTVGGTGKEAGDRHPKIRYGVMIGAGAKILGNIEVGHCARIAAGSVVIKPVPNNVTVAGVPAKVIGVAGCPEPARSMDQMFQDEL